MNSCQQCKQLSESLFFCQPLCQLQYFSSQNEEKQPNDEAREAERDTPVMMMRPENGRTYKSRTNASVKWNKNKLNCIFRGFTT